MSTLFRCVNTLAMLLFLSLSVHGQGEANNWYFGQNAGLSFNTGSPVALLDGQLSTGEGCASISSSSGNLLFYTDGLVVYNASHAVMPNGSGLLGGPAKSSSQCAMIVKKPGSQNLYYIFTVDENFNGGLNGFRYSIVDMTLNGGLGDVDPLNKNILVRGVVMERLTAAKHRNGSDFWILICDYVEDKIFAYRLSCNGLDMIPVKSNVGPFFLGDWRATFGCMKVSPQNDRIAMAGWYNRSVLLFDFDNSNGLASNRMDITNSEGKIDNHTYGVEFSPNGNLLYATTVDGPRYLFGQLMNDTLRTLQFILTSGNAVAIGNSLFVVASHIDLPCGGYSGYYGTLQLGPDQKIYSANVCDSKIGVINNPNQPGSACSYSNTVDLAGRISGFGLPNMFVNYSVTNYDTLQVSICSNDSYTLCNGTVVSAAGIYSCHISTATSCDSLVIVNLVRITIDTTNINSTICSSQLPYNWYTQTITQAGIYYHSLTGSTGCDSIIKLNLSISPITDTSINNVTICSSQLPYLWNNNNYATSGIYTVLTTTLAGCDSVSLLNLTIKSVDIISFDTIICSNELPFAWNNLNITHSGLYTVTLSNSAGCDSLVTLNVIVNHVNTSNTDITICDYQLPFVWNAINIPAEGTYYSTFTGVNGCDSIATLQLKVTGKPKPDLGNDRSICTGETIHVSPGDFDSYLWQDFSTGSQYTINHSGTYSVTVTNFCGSSSDDIVVEEKACHILFVNAFTPGDKDDLNNSFKPLHYYKDYHLVVYNRWGYKVFESKNAMESWDGSFNGQDMESGTYIWICLFTENNKPKLRKGTVLLIR